MAARGTGLVLVANGALALVIRFVNVTAFVGVVAALSLGWLATVEVEELNRQGVRPDVARHGFTHGSGAASSPGTACSPARRTAARASSTMHRSARDGQAMLQAYSRVDGI